MHYSWACEKVSRCQVIHIMQENYGQTSKMRFQWKKFSHIDQRLVSLTVAADWNFERIFFGLHENRIFMYETHFLWSFLCHLLPIVRYSWSFIATHFIFYLTECCFSVIKMQFWLHHALHDDGILLQRSVGWNVLVN